MRLTTAMKPPPHTHIDSYPMKEKAIFGKRMMDGPAWTC